LSVASRRGTTQELLVARGELPERREPRKKTKDTKAEGALVFLGGTGWPSGLPVWRSHKRFDPHFDLTTNNYLRAPHRAAPVRKRNLKK